MRVPAGSKTCKLSGEFVGYSGRGGDWSGGDDWPRGLTGPWGAPTPSPATPMCHGSQANDLVSQSCSVIFSAFAYVLLCCSLAAQCGSAAFAVVMSVRLSVCHSRDPRPNSPRYQSTLHSTVWSSNGNSL